MKEDFNPQEYRKNVADLLVSEPSHKKRNKLLEKVKTYSEYKEAKKHHRELEPIQKYADNGFLAIARPDFYESDGMSRPLTDKEKVTISELKEMTKEARELLTPFIEEKIKNGELYIFNNHGHLNYSDDKYWGHYTFPTKEGVSVTVYFKKEIKGDPMDIEGERGNSINIDVPLSEEARIKLADQMNKELEEVEEWSDWDSMKEDALSELLSGIEKK